MNCHITAVTSNICADRLTKHVPFYKNIVTRLLYKDIY